MSKADRVQLAQTIKEMLTNNPEADLQPEFFKVKRVALRNRTHKLHHLMEILGKWVELHDEARRAGRKRLKDAGKPLPAITREALEKQREERRTGLGQSVKQGTGHTHNELI
ncbi:hypothetical protein PC119_g22407 [Phytophthora cactorum]|nr:hypothetical protein PC119_g22407 [Phytophthora cactorum]